MSDLIKLQKQASDKKILYIDGDKKQIQNYSVYLKKSFQDFFVAYDGEDGFNQFQKHKPDVVMLNLELEKKDSLELITDIKDIDESVIVVSISDMCDNYELLQTLDMGLDEMLLKPVPFAKVVQVLISLLPPPPIEKKIEKTVKPAPKIKEKIQKKQEVIKPKKVTQEVIKKSEVKPLKIKKKEEPTKEIIKKEPSKVKKIVMKKSSKELAFDLLKDLYNKKKLVEFINNYKGIVVLHNDQIHGVEKDSFTLKANIAQILAAKSEKQIMIKTQEGRYIHAVLDGIDLKNSLLKLANPRILNYKQRDKEYVRIMADKSFKASVYFKKKHVDFAVSYISFRSAVLLTDNTEIDFKKGDLIDITLGFNISGPNAMIIDKKFIKIFAKCEVVRVDIKGKKKQIVILLDINKAGERTLKKYLSERESEIIYEFKSRLRR